MKGGATATTVLRSLDQRLAAAAAHLLAPGAVVLDPDAQVGDAAADLLPRLVGIVREPGRTAELWLLFVAVHGRYPTTSEYLGLSRSIDILPTHAVASTLLDHALRSPGPFLDRSMTVVSDAVVVEVDYSARSDYHTGIQRVVRETLPRWADRHDIVAAAWADGHTALRALAPSESARVFRFGLPVDVAAEPETGFRPDFVVPFGTDVVFPDVPVTDQADVASCLARFSGNRVSHVGYDLIPLTSIDLRPDGEAQLAALAFSVIKYSHRVACISSSATSEFAGMVESLASQGLTGPDVREVTLPVVGAPPPAGPLAARRSSRPVILLTGTREPHKNHRTVLHAANRLWHEGLDFEVRQVGGEGWSSAALDAAAANLTRAGRPLTMRGRVSEQELWDEMRAADAVVFISLHEGYGLPIAEALSVGTPVITTRYGSQAEVAAHGGCLTVDPRDDDDVTGALRRMVTDKGLRDRLAAEALDRPERTWDDYADDLWTSLIGDTGLEAGS